MIMCLFLFNLSKIMQGILFGKYTLKHKLSIFLFSMFKSLSEIGPPKESISGLIHHLFIYYKKHWRLSFEKMKKILSTLLNKL